MKLKQRNLLSMAAIMVLASAATMGCASDDTVGPGSCDATFVSRCHNTTEYVVCDAGLEKYVKCGADEVCSDTPNGPKCGLASGNECNAGDVLSCYDLKSRTICDNGYIKSQLCGSGFGCLSDNKCEPICNPVDYPKCDGSKIVTCDEKDPRPVTSDCPDGGFCDSKKNTCKPAECSGSETRCIEKDGESIVEVCKNGRFISDHVCGTQCANNVCLECSNVEDTEKTCLGAELKSCGNDGFWKYETCPEGKVCEEGKGCVKPQKPTGLVDPTDILTDSQMSSMAEPANRIYFDLDDIEMFASSESESMDGFLRFPYPSALRTNAQGMPSLKGLKLPMEGLWIIDIVKDAVQNKRPGFSPQGAVYMRSTIELDESVFPSVEDSNKPDSCVQLVNIHRTTQGNGKHFGERVPVYVTANKTNSSYMPSNTITIRPVPGLGMWPGERYAAFITNDCLKARSGVIVNQSAKLASVLDLTAPASYKSYKDAVKALVEVEGIVREKIYGFTTFVTSDVAREMDQLVFDAKNKGSIIKGSDGYAKGSWTTSNKHADVFKGTFKTANYIPKEGVIGYTFDKDGLPLLKTSSENETVEFAISVPKADKFAMPEDGYPLIVYGHGTGGDSTTHCAYSGDEGIELLANGVPVAMIGFDACLQGNRKQNGSINELSDVITLMMNNPLVIVESVRQTTLDMTILYELLEKGDIVLPPRPSAKDPVKFNNKYGMFMGHSQGSQEAGLLLGVEGRIKNAFLSAGGGGLSLAFTSLKTTFSSPVISAKDQTFAEVLASVLNTSTGSTGTIDINSFITQQIAQPLLDPIDPLNFAQRFVKEPVKGMEPKNIAMTTGYNDESTPMYTQLALATAIGLPTVGNQQKVSDDRKIAGFDTMQPSPASDNVTANVDGKVVTGGSMQFDPASILPKNPHFVIYYLDSAKKTYPAFFQSVLDGKPAIIVNN